MKSQLKSNKTNAAKGDGPPTSFEDRIWSGSEFRKHADISRSTERRMHGSPGFPIPRQISPRRVGYLESEIKAWMKSLPKAVGGQSQ